MMYSLLMAPNGMMQIMMDLETTQLRQTNLMPVLQHGVILLKIDSVAQIQTAMDIQMKPLDGLSPMVLIHSLMMALNGLIQMEMELVITIFKELITH